MRCGRTLPPLTVTSRRFAVVSCLFIVTCCLFVEGAYPVQDNYQQSSATPIYDQHRRSTVDPIQAARCDIKCWNHSGSLKTACLTECLDETWLKPGTCPTKESTIDSRLPNLKRACINSCRRDVDCAGTLKCCQHTCGITCQTALEIDAAKGIPSIAENITIDLNKDNPVEDGIVMIIQWSTKTQSATGTIDDPSRNRNQRVIYLIEERHHAGRRFVSDKLTDWTIRRRSTRTKIIIKNLYRPGRWYVFRITAVNENGTRGPSNMSTPFFGALSPKEPQVPGALKVGATSWGNGKLHLQLIWKAPFSELPINKYKVTYSSLKNFTLSQHHHTLPPSTTYFWLKELEPMTEYFLQVQAFSKLGKRRLPGETASIVFNTSGQTVSTRQTNGSVDRSEEKRDEKNHQIKYKRKIHKFRVDKLYWLRDQLLATVSWTPIRSNAHYYIRWAHNGCQNLAKTWYIAKTDMTTLEVYDLLPGCQYTITIRTTWQQSLYVSKITFSTDGCRRSNSTVMPASLILDCSSIKSPSTKSSSASGTVTPSTLHKSSIMLTLQAPHQSSYLFSTSSSTTSVIENKNHSLA